MTCKNCPRYDLCVWWDVKPCSINQHTSTSLRSADTRKLLHNQAPSYPGLSSVLPMYPVVETLRSANTDRLIVPHVRLSSVVNQAFPVAASCVWNSLPSEVTSAQSRHSFRWHLKTFLLQWFFPDVIMTL